MKLLQNSAGNFLNMTPQEAKRMAQQLLEAAEKSLTAAPGRGSGFVHTIVIQEIVPPLNWASLRNSG
jgi:uncharacterized protein YjeT (DUF2065 family)